MTFFVARTSSPTEFGTFGLAYAIFVFVLGCSRAMSGEVLLVISKCGEVKRAAVSIPLLVSAPLCLVAAATAGLLRGFADVTVVFFAMGGLVVVEDFGRYWANACLASGRAAVADVLSFAGQALVSCGLWFSGVRTGAWYVVVWGFSALLGILVLRAAAFFSAASYRPVALRLWLSSSRPLALSFLVDFMLLNFAAMAAQVVLVAAHGADASASIRGSQLLLGPLTVLSSGAALFLLPEVRRRGVLSRTSRSMFLALSGVLVAVALLWTVTLKSLSPAWGESLTGDSWPLVSEVLWEAGLYSAASALAMGGVLGLRSMEAGTTGLRLRLVVAPLVCLSASCGAIFGEASGLLLGAGSATAASAIVWWVVYLRVFSRRSSKLAAVDLGIQPYEGREGG
ncbi:hypothetical protein [Pseudonocardia sp. T1-2H]|uniref:hypothetical protein n=1 Tax=Pseudonocardia sp. T1-2H TaxID=3128899 RepID=UPI0031015062